MGNDREWEDTLGVAVNVITEHVHGLAGRESQLHNKPVAFSMSHDHRMVRLTGWGPVINGDFFTVHPSPIHSFDVIAQGSGKMDAPQVYVWSL
jgi:hypothetical protein